MSLLPRLVSSPNSVVSKLGNEENLCDCDAEKLCSSSGEGVDGASDIGTDTMPLSKSGVVARLDALLARLLALELEGLRKT